MLSTMDKKWFHLNGFKESNAAVCMMEQDNEDCNELMNDMFKLQVIILWSVGIESRMQKSHKLRPGSQWGKKI